MIKTSLEARIQEIKNVQMISEKFSKQEIILKTADDYNPYVSIQLINDKISLSDGLNQGELVKCYLNIYSKQHNDRYFTNINCWKIETLENIEDEIEPVPNPEDFDDEIPSIGQLPF